MKNNIVIALLTLATGFGVATASAQVANPTSSYTDGDLILAVWNTSTEFTLDLGAPASLNNSNGLLSTFTVPDSLTTINEDLTTAFGSSWSTASNLYFAVGAVGYFTNPLGSGKPLVAGNGASAINNKLGSFGNDNYTNNAPTGTPYVSDGNIESTGASESWYSYFSAAGTVGKSYKQTGVSVGDGALGTLISGTADFDSISSTQAFGTSVGSWSVASSGNLTFTNAAAVPEPSTWASIILGGAALLGVRRFRRA